MAGLETDAPTPLSVFLFVGRFLLAHLGSAGKEDSRDIPPKHSKRYELLESSIEI